MYSFTITAQNAISPNATQSFTLTVNQAPAITSVNKTTFTVGTAGTYNVTTTGYPTSAITVTGTLPTGVTFTDNGNGTGTFSGTPAAGTGGAYGLVVKATNAAGTAKQTGFTLTVNQAPAITSAANTTFTVGTPGSFTVTTSGFPVPSVSTTSTLPSGVTLVDNGDGTGTLGGTPAVGTGGVYSITLSAKNGVTPIGKQTFSLTVDEP